MQYQQSQEWFNRAQEVIPGGVNSPVRAFNAVEGSPPFIASAQGAYMWDQDENKYIDLIGSWGPMIVGHRHPTVIKAIQETLNTGTSFGAPTKAEVLFAEELCTSHPVLDMVRLCSSGTESTMHAIRLARGYTQRDIIVQIDGCFQGAHDSVLVEAGSGVATFAKPGSEGIPGCVAELTRTASFNDLTAIESHLSQENVAAVILEAVPGNMGCIVPKESFLKGLTSLCKKYGTLLIVDEVMTGYRLSKGGACQRFAIDADLVTLGKIVGGGLPLAAFGGRKEIMQHLSPLGPVYQAGTLSGNPLAVSAGRATLSLLNDQFYQELEDKSALIEAGLKSIIDQFPISFARVGSMFTLFFRDEAPNNFQQVKECDFELFAQFHRKMLDRGVYFPPSQYEAVFLSNAISQEDIQHLVNETVLVIKEIFSE
jgi:glutamate-1-semialdehyde 2,1-aminomutase